MRFAIPVVNGLLSMHFGHCSHFGLIDVDDETKSIQGIEYVDAPAHQPGLRPPFAQVAGQAGLVRQVRVPEMQFVWREYRLLGDAAKG